MITVAQPSMVLNATAFAGECKMWNTRDVDVGIDPEVFLMDVRRIALGAPGGRLRCLVLNSHGWYRKQANGTATGGYGLDLGTGIGRAHTALFQFLRADDNTPLVGDIIIAACGAARISAVHKDGNGDGNILCSEIARYSGSYVTAATTTQLSPKNGTPFGMIDDWEGLVLTYAPHGNVIWSHDFGRGLLQSLIWGSN